MGAWWPTFLDRPTVFLLADHDPPAGPPSGIFPGRCPWQQTKGGGDPLVGADLTKSTAAPAKSHRWADRGGHWPALRGPPPFPGAA